MKEGHMKWRRVAWNEGGSYEIREGHIKKRNLKVEMIDNGFEISYSGNSDTTLLVYYKCSTFILCYLLDCSLGLVTGIAIGTVSFIIGALIASTVGGMLWIIVCVKRKNKLKMSQNGILRNKISRHYKPFTSKSEVSPSESGQCEKPTQDITQQSMQGNVAYGQGTTERSLSGL